MPHPIKIVDSKPVIRGPVVRIIERRIIGVFSLSAGNGGGSCRVQSAGKP